ncbi:MAG: threonine--tRNA ligase [Elusimicrobia bacterium]|nr:threonine--tRNA ligase [Elusimicrobiota bacterium]
MGPSIEDGFYYDFDRLTHFVPEDLIKIEEKMKEIIKSNYAFEKSEKEKKDALKYFKDKGEKYKVEIIVEIPENKVTFYQTGNFVDLCRGPHIPSTGEVKYFKLLSLAGAYWRGDEKREQLQRIYGTAFFTKDELHKYLERLEEAKKRDHRKLGKELDLYSVNEDVGSGLVLWHPKGARVRLEIEDFWRKQHLEHGYEIVYTPHIGRSVLWETSGHLDFYKEYVYSPIKVDNQDFYVKPMNCPFHIKMYQNSLYSYRDLPVRWAELGTVYRYEKSGVLHGLLRVRGFTQDDAHIVCSPEQVSDEVRQVIRFCIAMLNAFGFKDFSLYLANKPKAGSVGSDENWSKATKALEQAVEAEGLKFTVDEGGGAFYGPKIDIRIKDALNREWQCSTIQFDFNLPERFDMTYIDQSGNKARPYMIHRALMGSLERFFGVLLEHYAGAFPVWLAATQAVVMNITDSQLDYAKSVVNKMKAAGIRVRLDGRNEKIGLKIREASLEKVPYILVVGDKEKEIQSVAVRARGNKDLGVQKVDDFIKQIQREAQHPKLDFV